MEQSLKESQSEASELKEKLSVAMGELEATKTRLSRAQMDVKLLQSSQEEQEEANTRLKEKLSRSEVGYILSHARTWVLQARNTLRPNWTSLDQAQLQTHTTESSEAELALHTEVRGLRTDLDEAKRKASRLNQEQREMNQRLEDTEKDRDTLKQVISQLEETKGQQERALEKLNKEVRRRDLSEELFKWV